MKHLSQENADENSSPFFPNPRFDGRRMGRGAAADGLEPGVEVQTRAGRTYARLAEGMGR